MTNDIILDKDLDNDSDCKMTDEDDIRQFFM